MNKKLFKRLGVLSLAAAMSLTLAACGNDEPEADPHEGMAYVNTGANYEWIYPAEGVPVSDFAEEDFQTNADGLPEYIGDRYETRLGVDVSFYQGVIDWEAVAADGVEFAMIRCGYRGSETGDIVVDEQFENNIQGALDAGLDVGVYFFSQSTGAIEAAEEANFVLSLIADYEITMPVAFDWEPLENSRAEDIDRSELTASAVVFCEMVKDAGYTPCVYLYRYIGYYEYMMERLADYEIWVGALGSWPDFYYKHSLWQFSMTGRVDGIDADVDLDYQFIPKPSDTEIAPPTASV
ncbi:MAG TPA: Lyzozyme M1 (1,4-beta-N-acetylmuramidase) [Candidatus Scatomorpha pullicola]|nr:Lyzozyme M1 (1,4-beta-N-acetylmuramidase) [Candidatus Scatomorpha pullicola]